MTSPFRVEKSERIAVVTLDDPTSLNALGTEMMQGLTKLWPELEADPAVRVVVLTGAGERAFCSGLKAQNIDVDPGSRPSVFPQFEPHVAGLRKPLIVAVNGVCASGGMNLLTHATIILAAERASFVDTHVGVGQVSGIEASALARRIPLDAVLRMVVLGKSERLSAARAKELGLVSEVLHATQLMPRALELAAVIAKNSPAAVRHSLAALWEGLDLGLDAAQQNAWRHVVEHRGHPDSREGGRAFLEKREPRWQD